MEDYVQSMNEYFSIMKEAGFDEYTHEARELFDDFVSRVGCDDDDITLVDLKEQLENDTTFTDDKNLFECFKNVIREIAHITCPCIRKMKKLTVNSQKISFMNTSGVLIVDLEFQKNVQEQNVLITHVWGVAKSIKPKVKLKV